MKNDNKPLLVKLERAEKISGLYLNIKKRSIIINRIEKFLLNPIKVILVTLYKFGFYRKPDFPVKMFWGKKFILPIWDENIIIAYYSGSFGLVEYPLVKFFIKEIKNNMVFYDIGSSFGLYTYLAEELGAKVYSFEPNKKTAKYIKMNSLQSTIVEDCALLEKEGFISFYDSTSSNKSGMSSIFADIAVGTEKGSFDKISVKSTTIDKYIIKHEIPDIIKIDVMNSDHFVLEGGKDFFTKYSPVIALRMYNTPKGISRTKMSLDLLNKFGYSSYKLDEDGDINLYTIEPEKLKFASTFIFKKNNENE